MLGDREMEDIIGQLDGRRDKHIIAHAYNCRFLGEGDDAFVVQASTRKMSRYRRLGLISKRPSHMKRPVTEADHILTDRGLAVGKVITERYHLALAQI